MHRAAHSCAQVYSTTTCNINDALGLQITAVLFYIYIQKLMIPSTQPSVWFPNMTYPCGTCEGKDPEAQASAAVGSRGLCALPLSVAAGMNMCL